MSTIRKNFDDAAVKKPHEVAQKITNQAFTQSIMAAMGFELNQSLIAVNVNPATTQHTKIAKKEKERDKALSSAMRSFGKSVQAHMDYLDALQEKYAELRDEALRKAREIVDGEDYQNAIDRVKRWQALLEKNDLQEMRLALAAQGLDTKDKTEEDIREMVHIALLDSLKTRKDYEDEYDRLLREANEYDNKIKEIEAEKIAILDELENGVSEEIALENSNKRMAVAGFVIDDLEKVSAEDRVKIDQSQTTKRDTQDATQNPVNIDHLFGKPR